MSDTSRDIELALASDLILKGWQPIWCPLRNSGAYSPEQGTTGSAPYMTITEIPSGPHRMAFRPPENILILDVDHYGDKTGRDTIDRAEAWLGSLPPTYMVTSRGSSGLSGRFLYRIPSDLVVLDSYLSQFADDEDSETYVDMVRTGHRFSWAPHDTNPKNGQTVLCYDEYGEVCDMPDVQEVPELPERWVEYFRNPPVRQGSYSAYQRPSDGRDWWLSQADDSLSTDGELAGFSFDMMLSRVPIEEIWEQWQRVSNALTTPWTRADFDRHTRSAAQGKVAEKLEAEDRDHAFDLHYAGSEEKLQEIASEARQSYENLQSFKVEPQTVFDPGVVQAANHQLGLPDYENWEAPVEPGEKPRELTLAEKLRTLEGYDRLFAHKLADHQASLDASKALQVQFENFEDISELEEPPPAKYLTVLGTGQPIIPPGTVTVISGNRASGKTWSVATLVAQEIRAGRHVYWLDFERQPRLLTQKLRAMRISAPQIREFVHYVGGSLPAPDRLVAEMKTTGPSIVVVDAFRGLQGVVSPGSSANDGDAVEAVYLSYLNPLVLEASGSVVLIDHLPKNALTTFGSERKESAADMVIRVVQRVPFAKKKAGYSTLEVTKDRYGTFSQGEFPAALWVPVKNDNATDHVVEPQHDDESDEDFSKRIRSIKDYPAVPEFRSWVPEGDGGFEQFSEDAASTAAQKKAQQKEILVKRQCAALMILAREGDLRFNQSELSRILKLEQGELFDISEASIRTNLLNVMIKEGMIEADSAKKLSIGSKYRSRLTEVADEEKADALVALLAGGEENF